MNSDKRSIFLGGVNDDDKSELLQVLGFPGGKFPIRYLGIPLSPRKLRIFEYDPLIQKLTQKVQAWSSKTSSRCWQIDFTEICAS